MLLFLLACILTDEDVHVAYDPDGDGHGSPEDCAPLDPTAYPGAEEICGDGVVNDCKMTVDEAQAMCDLLGETSLKRANLRIAGEAENDRAGSAVSSAGDVDGDGRSDLLIGAPGRTGVGESSGAAYLLLSSSSIAQGGPDLSLGFADVQFVGEDVYDHAGSAVSGAGDVDGDGRDDLLVGAPSQNGGGDNSGAAYLVFAKTLIQYSQSTIDLRHADVAFLGENSEDWAGSSVSSAGDVNGDGRPDLLIGAYGESSREKLAGAAYLWTSTTFDVGGAVLDLSAADLKIAGSDWQGLAGASISGGEDVDGDGLAEILVGAPYRSGSSVWSGAAYVMFSSQELGTTDSTIGLEYASVTLVAEEGDAHVGYSVSLVCDVDGDDRADVLIGHTGESSGGGEAGAAYLLLSSGALSLGTSTVDLSRSDVTLIGESSADEAGVSVSSAGDVDGDGLCDILVGAYGHDSSGIDAGAAYLSLSSGSLLSSGSRLSLGAADLTLNGEGQFDRAGVSVATAGDVSGDGRDDLLIGAYFSTTSGVVRGTATIINIDALLRRHSHSREPRRGRASA